MNSTVNPEWPDELDALVAAPGNHILLMENDRVRVVETIIQPGETTPIHTHRWSSALYVLSWSDFVRRDDKGNILAESRKLFKTPPTTMWGAPLPPHTLENIGSVPLRIIGVEVKDNHG